MTILQNTIYDVPYGVSGNVFGRLYPSFEVLTPAMDGTISLNPTRGSATPTFVRATTATFRDFEGTIKTAASGVERFEGAREDSGTYYWEDGSGNPLRPLTSDGRFATYAPHATSESGITVLQRRYVEIGGLGFYAECTAISTGTCGGSAPTWIADGSNITDGGVTWVVLATNLYRLKGVLIEGARTQYLGVTEAPATQTTASLGTGTYTLSMAGTGSVTSSAGTATGTGFGAATEGSPNTNTITLTGAGTVTVTVAGSVDFFQLENGPALSSQIPNAAPAGTSVTRNADVLTYPVAGWLNDVAGTLLVGATKQHYSSDYAQIVSLDAGSTADRISLAMYPSSGRAYRARVDIVNGGSVTVSDPDIGGVLSVAHRIGLAYATDDAAYTTNGSAPETDDTVTVPSVTTLVVGDRGGASAPLNGSIINLQYFPRRLSNAKLEALSARENSND